MTTAALIAIWEFLVALGPFLTALGGIVSAILVALIEVAKITAIITVIAAAFEILFDPRGKQRVANLIANITGGAISVAQPLLADIAPSLSAIVDAFVKAFEAGGQGIANQIAQPVGAFAGANFRQIAARLAAAGESTAANSIDQAAAALELAFGLGISSAGVTAAFEAAFPEKLNVLNGIGPMLAQMAGFAEVSQAIRDPLYRAAFGRSAEYQFKSIFKPDLPDEADAVTWHSRRLLTDDQLKVIFGFSGLKTEYETAFVESAYRAVQPRMFATLLLDQPFPVDQVRGALEFAGIRPADVTFLLDALEINSTKNVRAQFLSASVRAAELGTITPAELTDDLNLLNFSDDAKNWVQLTVATRKLEQLAELYRKSISEAYKYGQITDQQYVPALESIGIAAADAQAHYAIDSIAKTGKAAAAALKAEERLAAQQMRAASNAAIANFGNGTIDAAGLEAALLAAGQDPVIAGFVVSMQEARQLGSQVFVYGRLLPRKDALVVREEVTAIADQTKKQLIDDVAARAKLVALGIPEPNIGELLAAWAALKTKPTKTGELLPT